MFQKIITTLLLLAITVIVTVLIATVIRTKRNNPKYSYIMAIINTVLIPLELLQLGPFKHGKKIEFSVAMTEAIAKTDLNDYGNLNFIYNYGKIAELSLYKSLKFTNLGFFMAYKELQMVLMRRLQLVNYQKNYPSINQVPIRSPVFVMGLGRSGTTFVHRLLSLDPLVRSPLLWELVLPVPTINNNNNNYDDQINNNNSYSDNKTDDNSTINSNKIFYNKNTKKLFEEDRMKRAEFVKNRIKERKSFGDSILESLHEIGHDLPEECLMALSNDIPLAFHYVYTFLINITDLEQLLPSNEIVQAYQNYKFVLQLLSYQIGEGNNPRRWVLKCPLHTIFIPEILKVFPDAKFVWAHRNPSGCMPSVCTLIQSLGELYYEPSCTNSKFIGKKAYETAAYVLDKGIESLQTLGADCIHVKYDNLIADPIQTVKDIYNYYGWEFTVEYHDILKEFLRIDKKKRDGIRKKMSRTTTTSASGLHQHNLEQFGITKESLTTGKYKKYIDQYQL